MLKRKLKQWLAVNEPGALPVKTEPPGSPPTCVTPPLPRSPSTSDVNKYPSLKKKILGPKMVDADHPHAESPTTSSKENASTLGNKYSSNYASTSDLAAAAAFATGLQPSKRRREFDEPFRPSSPLSVKKERSDDGGSDRAKSPKTNKPKQKPKPRTPKPASQSGPQSPRQAKRVTNLDAETESEPKEPKEETDEEIARRLHAEFNCAPMRTSRSRRTMDLKDRRDGGTPEDPVHDNDPGILPSC